MGGRVARRLLAAGFPLGMYSRHPDSLRALVDLGARGYSSPRLLAANSDVVVSMLPDDAALERVVLGDAGVLSGIPAGSTIIDLSSVHPLSRPRCDLRRRACSRVGGGYSGSGTNGDCSMRGSS